MEYLLLAVLSIIIYAEILPTVSILFELIRTCLASKITLVQQYTVHMQEDIENTKSRLEAVDSVAIGFHVPSNSEKEYDYDE